MGFLLIPIYGLLMGIRLAALRAAGAPLLTKAVLFTVIERRDDNRILLK